MDQIRNNQIIQIIFFAIVVLLGVFLYSRSPAEPIVNTYNYLDNNAFFENEDDVMAANGFAVALITARKASSTEPTIEVVVESYVPDTCTMLVEKKNIYTDRTFNIELEPQQDRDAICLGGKSELTSVFPIELGRLTDGEYKIKVQNKSVTFDIKEIMTEELGTTTEDLTDTILNGILQEGIFE